MANSNRLTKSYLADLTSNPELLHKEGFSSLIRYLEANAPLSPKVGYSLSPKQDFARFGQQPLLHFYPAAFYNAKFSKEVGEYKLTNSYFGMLGINGPLPTHLTEHAIERSYKSNDHTFSHFLDIFNHRFISLFYRAWADAEPSVSHDRPKDDKFISRLCSISGNSIESDKGSSTKQINQYLSGLLSHKNHSAKVLIQALSQYLKVKVDIEEFVGKWLEISQDEQLKLGHMNSTLGLTTLGSRIYQRMYNFDILIGPISFSTYSKFLVDRNKINEIIRLTRQIVGNEYDFAIRIYLDSNQTKPSRLGSSMLGQTSWCQNINAHLEQNKPVLSYIIEC